jgi:hypothetical protein
MSKHYVNETGTDMVFDTGVLLGSTTQQYIKYKKPDGTTTGSFTASLYSSYSALANATGTYFLKHTLAVTDLNVPGEWRFQAYIGAVDGTWLGETVMINIYDQFE